MRADTLVPNGVVHCALNDTTVAGYTIPKDGFVITALHAAHLDKDKYENPEKFSPDRLLNKAGKMDLSKDTALPFGAGNNFFFDFTIVF